MSTPWKGSTRRDELPGNWKQIRQRVLARDHGLCQWRMSDGSICAEDANQVDHIKAKDTSPERDRLDRLQSLCEWHHLRKTAREANAAQTRHSTKHPDEAHPGLI